MSKKLILIVGIILGMLIPLAIDYILFGTIDPVTCIVK